MIAFIISTAALAVSSFWLGWYRTAYLRERAENERLRKELLRIKQDHDIR